MRLYEQIAADPGTVFLLGAPDTGKSTLAHYLLRRLVEDGRRTSFLDGDLGQSVLGPPATLALATPSRIPSDLKHLPWELLYFVGATSPAYHRLATAVGLRRLCDQARGKGSEAIVIDTSGLVAGSLGFDLKFHKIELLAPRHIVAVQKQKELEHILRACGGREESRIHRIPPSRRVRARSPAVRRRYREERLKRYFRGSSLKVLSLDPPELIHPGNPYLSYEEMDEKLRGRVLGLNNRASFTLALGIWEGYYPETNELELITPLDRLKEVRFIQVGDLSFTPFDSPPSDG